MDKKASAKFIIWANSHGKIKVDWNNNSNEVAQSVAIYQCKIWCNKDYVLRGTGIASDTKRLFWSIIYFRKGPRATNG